MIAININRLIANWIKSTTERLIIARAARSVGLHCNSVARPLGSKLELPRSRRRPF